MPYHREIGLCMNAACSRHRVFQSWEDRTCGVCNLNLRKDRVANFSAAEMFEREVPRVASGETEIAYDSAWLSPALDLQDGCMCSIVTQHRGATTLHMEKYGLQVRISGYEVCVVKIYFD